MKRLCTDVLVVGGGIAGLTAAITLADNGLKVVVVNRAFDPTDSNTQHAQGGIVWWGEEDSPGLLVSDIDRAGDDAGRKEAMKILAEEGPALVESFLIKRLKVPFDRASNGAIDRTKEAAHSCSRIIHVKDKTGAAIQAALLTEAKAHSLIDIMNGFVLIDILTNTHHLRRRHEETRALGAYVLNRETEKVEAILAPYTILATGGIGAIFSKSTNPSGARGDGIAAAVRAGAHVMDLEYVQFHPTALAKEGAPTFLISEAVRGEGATLLNQNRERFMSRYEPGLMELAPRDEVARAIFEEMKLQNTSHVWLDLKPIAEKGIDPVERFPGIAETCKKYGIDIGNDLIPVAPAAHYLCGGILVDGYGRTNGVKNLYAAGEVSCTGLHGANRLASTSLLEGLVWGKRAAENIVYISSGKRLTVDNPEGRGFVDDIDVPDWDYTEVCSGDCHELVAFGFQIMCDIMWDCVGIVRSEEGLSNAWRDLSLMNINIEELYRLNKLSDELIGLRNAVQVGILVTESARRNKKSRGCHFRADERGRI